MSQPLFWVFALIVGALILIWGMSSVIDLVDRGNYIQVLDAQEEIQKNIETYNHFDPGSAKTFRVSFPGEIEWVCFANQIDRTGTDCILSSGESCSTQIPNDMLDDLKFNVDRSTSENLFLLPIDAFDLTSFDVGDLKSVDDIICFENGNDYRIESQGTYVQIS